MQQLTFIKPGTLEWHEVPAPRLGGPGDALVRPVAVTTCDLDGPTIRGETPLSLAGPFAFGHEFIADVIDVGEGVRQIRRGERVIVPFQISCGECDLCRRGLTGSCRAVPKRSMFGFPPAVGGTWGGAFSDVVRVPFADHMLVALPDGASPTAVASLSDNIPDGWRTVAPYLGESRDTSVLIVAGSGHSIALYATAVARALGAQVDFIDTDPARLALASSFGATAVEGAPPQRAGTYDITVDASARPEGLECALRSLAPGGVCTSIGIYYNDMTPLPLLDMYGRGVHFFTGRVNARAIIPAVLELLGAGKFDPAPITSDVVPWNDAADALAEPSMKPVFVRD